MTAPRNGRIVTCEAMTSGHPDKLCDQISDALLDAHLVRDPYTRCGIEAAASGNEVWVFGQVASADPLSHAEIGEGGHLTTQTHHHQRCVVQAHRLRLIRQLIRLADRRPRAPERTLQRHLSRRIQLVPCRLTHLRECMTK